MNGPDGTRAENMKNVCSICCFPPSPPPFSTFLPRHICYRWPTGSQRVEIEIYRVKPVAAAVATTTTAPSHCLRLLCSVRNSFKSFIYLAKESCPSRPLLFTHLINIYSGDHSQLLPQPKMPMQSITEQIYHHPLRPHNIRIFYL